MPRKKTITGKKHKGFYIYSRDLLSSQRYRRCSWATKGVYLDLLNVLAVQDHPGALCLRDYDLKPRGERSLTQRCLACQGKAKNGEYQSLKYFAEAIAVSVSGPRPGLIHGLQELYMRGIIYIIGDVLYQPRMYRDSGIIVTDFSGNAIEIGDAEGAYNSEEKVVEKGTENGTQNVPESSRVGAGDAHAQSKRVGVRVNNNNINNNEDNNVINKAENEKSEEKKKNAAPTFDEFWELYDKKVDRRKAQPLWEKLSRRDREAIIAYIPQYIEAQPDKQFRKHPTTFLRNRSWEDEIIPADTITRSKRKNAPEAAKSGSTLKQGVQVTETKNEEYNEDW